MALHNTTLLTEQDKIIMSDHDLTKTAEDNIRRPAQCVHGMQKTRKETISNKQE